MDFGLRSSRNPRFSLGSPLSFGPWILGITSLTLLVGCESGHPPEGGVIPVESPNLRTPEDTFDLPELAPILDAQLRRNGPGLIRYLSHVNPRVRARAALALASVQEPSSRSALEELLGDSSPSVRRDAAFALGRLPPMDEGRALVSALGRERVPEVRLQLIAALGRQGGEEATEALLRLAPEPGEGAPRLWALGQRALERPDVRLPEVLAELAGGLYDPDLRVQEAGAYPFGRAPDPRIWAGGADILREAMDALAPSAPALMHLALAFGNLADPADASRLIGLLERGEDWRIRTNAARALANPSFAERREVREKLWRSLEVDPSEHVALAAAEALTAGIRLPDQDRARAQAWIQGESGRWRSHFPFLRPLASVGLGSASVEWVRRMAEAGEAMAVVRGLEVVAALNGGEITEELFEWAAHPHPWIRGKAVSSLADRWTREQGDLDVLLRYMELFSDAVLGGPPLAAASAARALGNPMFHPFGSVSVLLGAWEERWRPWVGEREIPSPELPVLEALLRAMGEAGDLDLLPLLEEALSAPDYRVRRVAGEARKELTGQEPRGLNLPNPERTLALIGLQALGSAPEWVLETDRGELVIRMVPDQAPLTVQTLATLTRAGAFDGTPFHRVLPNFVVQGGDVGIGDGSGGPGFSLRTELTQIPFQRGVIGMASAGRDTEGSQFYLTHSMQPHLDGGYTAFGWVIAGEEVLDRILEGDRIRSATLRLGGSESGRREGTASEGVSSESGG